MTAPLVRETVIPYPIADLAGAMAHQPYPFFLDSGMQEGGLGRYSFLGCDPFLVLRCSGHNVEAVQDGAHRRWRQHPLDALEGLMHQYALPRGEYPVPFIGGAVGYLAYDLGRLIERLPPGPPADAPVPDLYLCFYDGLIAYEHMEQRAYLVSTGLPAPPGPARSARAARRLEWLQRLATAAPQPCDAGAARGQRCTAPRSNVTREAYLGAVQRARQYIIAGDIYQVNLSQRFQAPWQGSPWDLYRRLRAVNPAPFAAYLDLGELAIVSASPERFLRVSGDLIETRPIKGTRPRGRTPQEDGRLACELAASAKDRAEHIMIVDLERNDLGRVSRIGTVAVDEMMALERYATVHHLTSTIHGRLRPDKGIADLLRATFPGGSITGAPKIRAMKIIDELEPVRRGVYTGAIGYFSFTGDLDLSIAIRTMVVKDGVASFHVGGGIVYDSDPEAEYQETLDKGRALLAALG